MQYLIAVLEGIITFISPCLLPMLPIYISYFAGGIDNNKSGNSIELADIPISIMPAPEKDTPKRSQPLIGALGFVLGFTIVFVVMGALAGSIGGFLAKYETLLNIICGAIVVFFGLNYLGVFKFNMFKGGAGRMNTSNLNFFSAMLFGMVFSIGWTPCVGAFLGSALMLASQQGHVFEGMLLLLFYSIGLGIPFILSAVLIDYLKSAFNWIKKNYKFINLVSGGFLVLVGILMATGMLGKLLAVLS